MSTESYKIQTLKTLICYRFPFWSKEGSWIKDWKTLLKSLDKERLRSELSHTANTKNPCRKPQEKRLSTDRLYHYCNLSYISWKLPDDVSVLEKIKCPGLILCQKEYTQTGAQVSPGDSLCLSDIRESLALNSVNPDFTPCRLVLDREVTGRAQSKQSAAYPNQWEFLWSGVLAIFDTFLLQM